jgi:type IX secretion system PorP/SprF family membrane protein
MSIPSFSNIDRWLFERMEGNLSSEQLAQLQAFLLKHPELDVDQDMWELSKVGIEEFVFPNQQSLIKRNRISWYAFSGYSAIACVILIGLYVQFNWIENIPFSQDLDQHAAHQPVFVQKHHSPISKQKAVESNSGIAVITENSIKHVDEINSPNLSDRNILSPKKGNLINLSKNNERQNYSIGFYEKFQEVENIRSDSNFALSESSNLQELKNVTQQVEVILRAENLAEKLTENPEIIHSRGVEINESISIQKLDKLLNTSQESAISSKSSKLDYGYALHAKMRKMARSIQRMMDNPIALKNRKDTYYHVPGMQAMDINFGSVGTLLATRVQTVSRAQWLGQENQQIMNQLSIDGYSYGMRGGVGFQFNHNYYGTGGIENYNASLLYSPKFSIARNVLLEPSIRFKMGSKSVNSDQLQSGSFVEYDRMNSKLFYSPGEQPIGKSLWYKDLGLGLMVNTKWFYVGIQGDNLLQHYDNIYSSNLENPRRTGKHFVATIGTDYESKKEKTTFSPYFVYQKQEALEEGWLGMNFRYHWLIAGAAISTNLEPAISLGLNFNHFMFIYNADYTNSQVLNKNNLSHQLTVRFLSKPGRFGQRLLNQAL